MGEDLDTEVKSVVLWDIVKLQDGLGALVCCGMRILAAVHLVAVDLEACM